ncbi:MAG: DUF4760 domain-containing protein [Pseudanabaenales cyanobacterium]|nr:DUF4760 domain-containing protein [Pseudanabaenales cyanobacterium]
MSSSENQLIDRTLIYITRWNNPQFLAIQKTANDIYHRIHSQPVNQQAKFLIDYLEQNPDKRQNITNALNFLEEMAICSQKGIIKEDLIYSFYRSIVITYYETFSVYIEQRRKERNNPNLYRCLADLCEKWEKV